MKSLTIIALAAALLGSVTAATAASSKASQNFIKDAIEGNLAEVQMGQLAQQKGQSEAVKSYGQMLVTDHTAANEKATAVANQIGVTPPTAPNAKQKAMYDKMSKLSGAAFDKAFAKDMVADHKKDTQGVPEGSQDEERPGRRFRRQYAADAAEASRRRAEIEPRRQRFALSPLRQLHRLLATKPSALLGGGHWSPHIEWCNPARLPRRTPTAC